MEGGGGIRSMDDRARRKMHCNAFQRQRRAVHAPLCTHETPINYSKMTVFMSKRTNAPFT
eukprot:11190756-Prorocentrum_lima.AAC.1